MAKDKYLLACRHSDKTPDGKHISAAGLQLVFDRLPYMIGRVFQMAGNGGMVITDFFHGIEVRTSETMAAGVCATRAFGATIHAEPIAEMGDDETFGSWIKAGFSTLVKGGMTNLQAAKSVLDGRTASAFSEMCRICFTGISDAFSQMTGQFGLGFFHSPTVEMSAVSVWAEMPEDLRLNSLDGILFKQDEAGVISVIGVVRAQ